jgi:hypothetical protein
LATAASHGGHTRDVDDDDARAIGADASGSCSVNCRAMRIHDANDRKDQQPLADLSTGVDSSRIASCC